MRRQIINQIVADIRYNSIYTCNACGKQQIGTTSSITLKAQSADEFKESMDSIEQSPHDMPYGWSSHPNKVYNCGCHKSMEEAKKSE